MSPSQFFFLFQSRVLLTLEAPVATNPQKLFAPLKFLFHFRCTRVLAKSGYRRTSEIVLCPGCVLFVWLLSSWLEFQGRTKLLLSK
jgi:hypothetical protein